MVDPSRQETLRRAIELLFFGYREFTDRPDRILERRGLGRVHHRILYFVGRNPAVSVKGLLEILAVSKQALSVPLRQLTEMKLVAVLAGTSDRRVKRLVLTPEGRRLEADLTGTQMRRLSAAFEAAGDDDEAGWMRVMERLARTELQPSSPAGAA
ncbi:MAG TPA: MarR family transcriptional regulator [Caulobacteraceae bacterium]|nr:MarR family transcriptional regulator [Caulobacteraceae bacterium]